jgi:hypothetical protein
MRALATGIQIWKNRTVPPLFRETTHLYCGIRLTTDSKSPGFIELRRLTLTLGGYALLMPAMTLELFDRYAEISGGLMLAGIKEGANLFGLQVIQRDTRSTDANKAFDLFFRRGAYLICSMAIRCPTYCSPSSTLSVSSTFGFSISCSFRFRS